MPVHRLGQAEELLRSPRLGETPAVVLQVGLHPLVRHTGSVRKPAAEFLFGAIGRQRYAARQRQAFCFIAAALAEPHDLPLQVAEADRHRVAPGGSADHDQATDATRKARGQRQCHHSAVRGAHCRVQGVDSDLLTGRDDRCRLVDRRDRREGPALHRAGGPAAAPQPVEAQNLELFGVESPPGTDLLFPPPFRIGPAGHVPARRDTA
jgi:hypothetical protein